MTRTEPLADGLSELLQAGKSDSVRKDKSVRLPVRGAVVPPSPASPPTTKGTVVEKSSTLKNEAPVQAPIGTDPAMQSQPARRRGQPKASSKPMAKVPNEENSRAIPTRPERLCREPERVTHSGNLWCQKQGWIET
jgi:hypothetical protein